MSRIKSIDRTTAQDSLRRSFDAIEKQLGTVPNMMRTMAVSPVVLEGYLALNAALARGGLSPALREQIALAVAEANACDYCLSAHTALGRHTGVADAELEANRDGRSANPKVAAALQFALTVVEERGAVSDHALAAVRAAGFSDREIAEIVAHVALNVFTNYFNRVAQTEIDFPKVTARSAATVP